MEVVRGRNRRCGARMRSAASSPSTASMMPQAMARRPKAARSASPRQRLGSGRCRQRELVRRDRLAARDRHRQFRRAGGDKDGYRNLSGGCAATIAISARGPRWCVGAGADRAKPSSTATTWSLRSHRHARQQPQPARRGSGVGRVRKRAIGVERARSAPRCSDRPTATTLPMSRSIAPAARGERWTRRSSAGLRPARRSPADPRRRIRARDLPRPRHDLRRFHRPGPRPRRTRRSPPSGAPRPSRSTATLPCAETYSTGSRMRRRCGPRCSARSAAGLR